MDVAAVGQDGALWPPGRAAREQDDERVVLVDRAVGKGGAGAVGLEGGEVLLENDRGHAMVESVQALQPPPVTEEDTGPGQLEAVGHLRAGPPAVERHGDGTEARRGPEGQSVFGA